MAVTNGFCFICNQKARFTCSLCGKPVCSKHFNIELSICTDCLNGPRIKTGELK